MSWVSKDESSTDFEEWSIDIHEWLGMVSLQSPRVTRGHDVDPFISRYRVPIDNDGTTTPAIAINIITWRGLIPSSWVQILLVRLQYVDTIAPLAKIKMLTIWYSAAARKHDPEGKHFFSITACGFPSTCGDYFDDYTILCPPEHTHSGSTNDDGKRIVLFKAHY